MTDLVLTIKDFHVREHLSEVMRVGRQTSEFATGEKIVFWSPDTLRLWSLQAGGPMLVALNQHSEMVGFLLATFHEAGIATLENVYVSGSFRRHGIANKLLDELERRAADANMKMIRSFGHSTNTAVSHLLTQRGYLEGALTQWYCGTPQTMNPICKEPSDKRISIRKVQPHHLRGEEYLALQESGFVYNAPGSESVTFTEWLIGSGQVTYGAFRDKRLIGLVASSIHELTNKATIERLLVDHSPATSSIIKLLLDSLLQDLATQCVSFVTAHPPIQEAEVPGLMELLELLGFEKRLIFRANTLAIDVSADLLSSDHVGDESINSVEKS